MVIANISTSFLQFSNWNNNFVTSSQFCSSFNMQATMTPQMTLQKSDFILIYFFLTSSPLTQTKTKTNELHLLCWGTACLCESDDPNSMFLSEKSLFSQFAHRIKLASLKRGMYFPPPTHQETLPFKYSSSRRYTLLLSVQLQQYVWSPGLKKKKNSFCLLHHGWATVSVVSHMFYLAFD